MNFRKINLDSYKRRDHFEHFLTMNNPFIHITVQLDISEWFCRIKEKNLPFFLSFQYTIMKAANSVPEFRQRIRDGGIVEYEYCKASYTVSLPDGTYRYCTADTSLPFNEYLSETMRNQAKAVVSEHLEEDGDPESYLFISTTPWLSYASLEMPYPDNLFSVPSIVWGKYEKEKILKLVDDVPAEQEKVTIPLTIMVNHALVDGIHIGSFVDALNKGLREDFI